MNYLNHQPLYLLIFSIIYSVHANLWDNIFGNFKSPSLVFPKNWETMLTYKNDLLTFNISLYYSSTLGSFKAEVLVDLLNTDNYMTACEILLHLSEDQLYFHTPNIDCEIYQTPLKGNFNNTDITNIWKMIAFYNGETVSGLKQFDISELFSMIYGKSDLNSKIYTFFNKKSQLNYIEIITNGKIFSFDVIEKLKEKKFSNEFFDVPDEWNCQNKTILNLTDINTYGMENVLKELISDNQQKNKNGTDFDLLDDPKN